jgi:HK97 family phage major capsid protein/HK97 family phage prohead protease
MNRAYAVLNIKSVDTDKRIITGIATTPATDRVGDTINPLGAKFADELPLLWQHQHGSPVGTARFGKATKAGIPFTAELPTIEEAGPLKDMIDMAWQAVKARLVKGVSVGFKAVKYAFTDTGIDFEETEIYELSLVTVPANAEATITGIKSLDAAVRQAMGLRDDDADRPRPASRETVVKINSQTPRQEPMKTIGEQIATFQAARAAKVKAQADLMQKSADRGETMNADEQAEFDTLQGEVDALDGQIKRLEILEKSQATSARTTTFEPPVVRGVTPQAPASPQIVVATQKSKAPGVAFAQYTRCLLLSKLLHRAPSDIAKQLYGDDQRIVTLTEKAAVAAANTLNDSWAGALVSDEGGVFADFNAYLYPRTILGQFGEGGRPSLNRVPFRVPFGAQTGKGTGYWVGEGKAKPVTKGAFARDTLTPLKVAAITVATKELLRSADPNADTLLRNLLVDALQERLDIDFIDPAKAAVANVSPAGILNGLTPLAASGTGDYNDIVCDIQAIMGAFIAANNAPSSGVWIMPTTVALALSLVRIPDSGALAFPGLSMQGGTFFGLPVIVSDYVPVDTAGAVVALVNARDIYLGDEGGFSIDVSGEASLQMDDAPTNASVSGAGNDTVVATSLVSMFQTNSIAFLAEREINWMRNPWRVAAVYMTGVQWGACATP